MSVVFLQITNVTRNNSYPTLAAIFPNTNVIKNAMKLVDISANDPNVINIAAIKYKIFSKFSIIIFLNVKKSYIHPKNPVNFPSFFLLKNVKYNTIPPITASITNGERMGWIDHRLFVAPDRLGVDSRLLWDESKNVARINKNVKKINVYPKPDYNGL